MTDSPENILILSNCRFGDSLVMVPALQLLRRTYPSAHICLLSERDSRGFVTAEDILGDRGLVDAFATMTASGSPLKRILSRIALLLQIRRTTWDIGVFLMPPYAPLTQTMLHKMTRYLRWFGAKKVIAPPCVLTPASPALNVVDATLQLLAPLGLPLPPPNQAEYALPPLRHPQQALQRASELLSQTTRQDILLAVAPSTNMPSKQWAFEKFVTVLSSVQEQIPHLRPVFFGSANDAARWNHLIEKLHGIAVIGEALSTASCVMERCQAFFGHDTGVMHLAAISGKPCVALFSARDPDGMWTPYGHGHRIFRIQGLPCEHCHTFQCPHPHHPCMAHRPEDVIQALLDMLQR